MAQFTTHGRLKLLFNGESVSPCLGHKDPFHYKCRSIHTHKRRVRCIGSSARIYHASSSHRGRISRCNAKAPRINGNEVVHEEYYDNDDDEDEDEHEYSYEDGDVDDVFEDDGLSCFRGHKTTILWLLLRKGRYCLNQDNFNVRSKIDRTSWLPLLSKPVNVVGWKRAICLEFMEKADVLEYYAKTVSSPSGSFYIPAVLRVPHLLQVVKRRIVKNNLSRKNILFRDNYTCQYCSSHENLTIDHVVPTARGGEWTWENLVRHI
ncbi:hypothetical protein Ahy_A06g029273 isoform B [Arachis hypogaea]|uniref:HNH nuclease domain-containing protein n=1 Tax=Arachis hypogaea TaxID=3818 RepID=A0A445CSY9_ARAHY|nr:hypothetical protein Ahy_A06g029273 isoform B [Arachis hypogaea]